MTAEMRQVRMLSTGPEWQRSKIPRVHQEGERHTGSREMGENTEKWMIIVHSGNDLMQMK